jgi:hypothetical protein
VHAKRRYCVVIAMPSVLQKTVGIKRIGLIKYRWPCGLRRGPADAILLG